MIFSPDFLVFFEQTAPLLDSDDSIWCISSWNDNGVVTSAFDNKRLFRTGFFPGLGWMLRKQLWDEVLTRNVMCSMYSCRVSGR